MPQEEVTMKKFNWEFLLITTVSFCISAFLIVWTLTSCAKLFSDTKLNGMIKCVQADRHVYMANGEFYPKDKTFVESGSHRIIYILESNCMFYER